ncbi:hypothetical protein BGS_1034 [Beggiatoa sp. SS]|nr:hypothetical protein BGS_1034 [Beggiatoa sp. SS]
MVRGNLVIGLRCKKNLRLALNCVAYEGGDPWRFCPEAPGSYIFKRPKSQETKRVKALKGKHVGCSPKTSGD